MDDKTMRALRGMVSEASRSHAAAVLTAAIIRVRGDDDVGRAAKLWAEMHQALVARNVRSRR